MKIIEGNILDVKEGIILHQVNCQNKIGAGISGQLVANYPIIAKAYHQICERTSKAQLFGVSQFIRVSDTLIVGNLFAQFYYGNSVKTGIKYTDEKTLIDQICYTCETHNDKIIYIPFRIGCGLAGGSWDIIYNALLEKDFNNLVIVRKSFT